MKGKRLPEAESGQISYTSVVTEPFYLRPNPSTRQRDSLEQTHNQLPVVDTQASVLSLCKQNWRPGCVEECKLILMLAEAKHT